MDLRLRDISFFVMGFGASLGCVYSTKFVVSSPLIEYLTLLLFSRSNLSTLTRLLLTTLNSFYSMLEFS